MDRFSRYLLRISKKLRRAKWWNYSNSGFYFITITTAGKLHLFGEIENGEMKLSFGGLKVQQIWNIIPFQFKFIKLYDFVIMPNHVHGLIEILKPDYSKMQLDILALNLNGGITGPKNLMFTNNLSRVIRWFKGRSTFEIRKKNKYFCWSKNFHDVIVRDEVSKKRIASYIQNNIKNWSKRNSEFELRRDLSRR